MTVARACCSATVQPGALFAPSTFLFFSSGTFAGSREKRLPLYVMESTLHGSRMGQTLNR
jgi:hypothetical protein